MNENEHVCKDFKKPTKFQSVWIDKKKREWVNMWVCMKYVLWISLLRMMLKITKTCLWWNTADKLPQVVSTVKAIDGHFHC